MRCFEARHSTVPCPPPYRTRRSQKEVDPCPVSCFVASHPSLPRVPCCWPPPLQASRSPMEQLPRLLQSINKLLASRHSLPVPASARAQLPSPPAVCQV